MRKQKPEQPVSASNLVNTERIRLDSRIHRKFKEEALQEFWLRYLASATVRETLVEVLTKSLDDAILKSESEEVFTTSPNPVAVLADLSGYRRGLRDAIKLLTTQETK